MACGPIMERVRRRGGVRWAGGEGGEGGGAGVKSVCAWPWSYDHRPSHSYYAGTEHVGFSPTTQTFLAPSAKRREVFGESHEACILPRTARKTDFGTLCLFSCLWMTATNELLREGGGGGIICCLPW